MLLQSGRYKAAGPASFAEGWTLERLTPPSRLFGANGLRTGPDGRIYVAQVSGSQISAIDVDDRRDRNHQREGRRHRRARRPRLRRRKATSMPPKSPKAGSVCARPMAPRGCSKATCLSRIPSPSTRGACSPANAGPAGGSWSLTSMAARPRVMLEDVPMPNAMEVGPDGKLYFPVMGNQRDLAGRSRRREAGNGGEGPWRAGCGQV